MHIADRTIYREGNTTYRLIRCIPNREHTTATEFDTIRIVEETETEAKTILYIDFLDTYWSQYVIDSLHESLNNYFASAKERNGLVGIKEALESLKEQDIHCINNSPKWHKNQMNYFLGNCSKFMYLIRKSNLFTTHMNDIQVLLNMIRQYNPPAMRIILDNYINDIEAKLNSIEGYHLADYVPKKIHLY